MQSKNGTRIGEFLLQASRSFSRNGRLAGMIQVCRPNWPASSTWQVAQALREQGVGEYRKGGSLRDYLASLDTRLTQYARQHHLADTVSDAGELEIKRWADKWQHYRNMASADERHSHAMAA